MAAPEERWCRLASKRIYGAGDPLSLRLVTTIRRPIQCSWLQPQSPYVARRIVVVLVRQSSALRRTAMFMRRNSSGRGGASAADITVTVHLMYQKFCALSP
jgi:hypothetical protein